MQYLISHTLFFICKKYGSLLILSKSTLHQHKCRMPWNKKYDNINLSNAFVSCLSQKPLYLPAPPHTQWPSTMAAVAAGFPSETFLVQGCYKMQITTCFSLVIQQNVAWIKRKLCAGMVVSV